MNSGPGRWERVGDFEYFTGSLIGHGAFACVFKGRHRKKHGVTVAVKSIQKKNLSKSQNLLGKEIKILKELTELHHENVVALLDCKETVNTVFLVMEYCNGGDLADYLHIQKTLSEDTIRLFLIQLVGALKAFYAKAIVHRDLKPQNILLCHSGKPNPPPQEIRLKIADFGFARFLHHGVMAGTLCGSPMYMAPEVIMSLQYDAKADLWSVGTIVYQMLTAVAPFHANTPQALKTFYEQNAKLTPKTPHGTSPELHNLLVRLLKRNAKDRLDFEELFNHPFLMKTMKPSSPVPVPVRQHSIPREIMASVKSQRTEKSNSGSSGTEEELPGEVMSSIHSGSSPYDQARFNKGQGSPCSIDGPDDFVIVSPNLSTENYVTGTENVGSGLLKRKSADIFGSSPVLVGTPPKMSSSPSSGLLHKRYSSPMESPSPRPSFLPVSNSPSPASIGSAGNPSMPIPVPSQVAAYRHIQESLMGSARRNSSNSGSSGQIAVDQSNSAPKSPNQQWDNNAAGMNANGSVPRSDPLAAKHGSQDSLNRMTPDVASLSPPSVQFMMGTPPLGGRRTSFGSLNTPPPTSPWPCGVSAPFFQGRHLTNSPVRKSSMLNSPPNSNYFFGGNCGTNFPAITDGTLNTLRYPPASAPVGGNCNPFSLNMSSDLYNNVTSPSQPLFVPFGSKDIASGGAMDTNSGSFLQRSGSAGRLNDGFYGVRNVFCNSSDPESGLGRNTIMPYNRHSGGLVFDCDALGTNSFGRSPHDTTTPPGATASGPFHFGSPTLIDEPMYLVAPELTEETIMEKEHNEILAKLNFVSTLVDCIIDLAKIKANPLGILDDSKTDPQESQVPVVSENCRRAEQLVLYFRALQLLSASLNLSREELKTGRLQPSNCVKNVVMTMNKHYHYCLQMCKSLRKSPNLQQAITSDPRAASVTADKLLYNYAIHMCQSAAIDELFGRHQDCFRLYQMAQILLHSLAQQINNENDRYALNKYREAVEKRLYLLQQQGIVYSYNTNVT